MIKALSTVASAVDQIQRRQRRPEPTPPYEGMPGRLQDWEEADRERERLIGVVSRNVENLAKAIATEIENNRALEFRIQPLV